MEDGFLQQFIGGGCCDVIRSHRLTREKTMSRHAGVQRLKIWTHPSFNLLTIKMLGQFDIIYWFGPLFGFACAAVFHYTAIRRHDYGSTAMMTATWDSDSFFCIVLEELRYVTSLFYRHHYTEFLLRCMGFQICRVKWPDGKDISKSQNLSSFSSFWVIPRLNVQNKNGNDSVRKLSIDSSKWYNEWNRSNRSFICLMQCQLHLFYEPTLRLKNFEISRTTRESLCVCMSRLNIIIYSIAIRQWRNLLPSASPFELKALLEFVQRKQIHFSFNSAFFPLAGVDFSLCRPISGYMLSMYKVFATRFVFLKEFRLHNATKS